MHRNDYAKDMTKRCLKELSEQSPGSAEDFVEQIKEGTSDQRRILTTLLKTRISPDTSPEEKLEIARTCIAAQFEYYRHDPDYPPEDFVALYQLSQLIPHTKTWEDLKHCLCMD